MDTQEEKDSKTATPGTSGQKRETNVNTGTMIQGSVNAAPDNAVAR